MALTTQCPQCGTAFKVVADQLRVRNGLVRCGVCTAVFDGTAHLQPEPIEEAVPVLQERAPSAPSRPVHPPVSAPVPPASWAPTAAPVSPAAPAAPAATSPRPSRQAFTPAVDSVPPVARPQAPEVIRGREQMHRPVDEYDRSSAWPDSGEAAVWHDVGDAFPRQDIPAPAPSAPVAASPIYGETRQPVRTGTPSDRSEPAASRWSDRRDERPDHPPIQFSDEPVQTAEPAFSQAEVPFDRTTADPSAPMPSWPAQVDADDWSVQGEARMRYVDDPTSGRTPPEFMDEGVQARRDSRARGWGTACLLMVLVLMLQAAYVWRTQLATRAPALRPVLEAACRSLQCEVGYERRIERISIMSSSLAPADGATAGESAQRLVLRVVLRNRYNVAQPWPALSLQLKDLSDTDVVRKTILPKDYLPVDAVRTVFPANGERTIVLPMTVRNAQVNGYQLEKFFP